MKNVSLLFVVFAVLACTCWRQSASGSWANVSRRTKRIVPGYKIEGRDVGYNVLKYYVWLGRARYCDVPNWIRLLTPLPYVIWRLFGYGPRCYSTPEHLLCGGALITPKIVSTACHCVANPVGQADHFFARYVLKNHYIDRMEAFITDQISVNKFDQSHFILSNAYYIHPRCARLMKIPNHNTYDFGWIYLEKSTVDSPMKDLDITFAPAYTDEELKKLYKYVTTNEAVCLVTGYGYYKGKEFPSIMMRYGWAWTQSVHQCFLYSTKFMDLTRYYDFSDIASWVCQREFSTDAKGTIAPGDSGSPITCDNKLFAVASSRSYQYLEPYGKEDLPNWYMNNEATSSAPFMFGSDHRKDFELNMENLGKTTNYYRRYPDTWTMTTFDWGLRRYASIEPRKNFLKSLSPAIFSARTLSITLVFVLTTFALQHHSIIIDV